MILTSLSRFRDAGLLFLRVALGAFFLYAHGWHKLTAGAHEWTMLGKAISNVGIHFGYLYWGLLATVAETLGCILVILGFLFRPACILLFITMTIASMMLIHQHKGWENASQPIELAILFFSLIFIGAGKYSLDKS